MASARRIGAEARGHLILQHGEAINEAAGDPKGHRERLRPRGDLTAMALF